MHFLSSKNMSISLGYYFSIGEWYVNETGSRADLGISNLPAAPRPVQRWLVVTIIYGRIFF